MYDLILVGARVAGLRTAECAAQKRLKVLVLEQGKEIGIPVQCAGLVSSRFLELLPEFPKKYILNKVPKARFFSPSGSSFELSAKPFAVIDRAGLDQWLARRAEKAGAEIKLRAKFLSYLKQGDTLKIKTNKGELETKLLVGADGPSSDVANAAGIKLTKNLIGVQATVSGEFDKGYAELHFGSKIAPKYFAWVVPLSSKKARVGLATYNSPKKYFDNFTRKRLGFVPRPDVGGLIKFGLQKQTVADNIMLIGDAASQVKPFSGGGIIYSLLAAEKCASAAEKAVQESSYGEAFLRKHYEKEWCKILEKPIKRGLRISKLWFNSPDVIKEIAFNIEKKWCIAQRFDPDFY